MAASRNQMSQKQAQDGRRPGWLFALIFLPSFGIFLGGAAALLIDDHVGMKWTDVPLYNILNEGAAMGGILIGVLFIIFGLWLFKLTQRIYDLEHPSTISTQALESPVIDTWRQSGQ